MQCPTHSTKKLAEYKGPSSKRCEICYSQATHYCHQCDYVQCDTCLICPKRHILQKMIDLPKVKPEYSSGGYGCDICKKQDKLNDDGIWHCNECNWGCCPECYE